MPIDIHVFEQSSGRWIAASDASPYFCFEGASREAVEALSQQALDFVAQHRDLIAQRSAELKAKS